MKKKFSIRARGGLGVSIGIGGGSVTVFVITDEEGAHQNYLYKAGDAGLSLPISPNFGSSESEFLGPDIDVIQFAGWVSMDGQSVVGPTGVGDSGTRITWCSGQAQGLEFVSTGWSLSLSAGISYGSFEPEGIVVNIGPRPHDWPIPRNTLAIWHPDPNIKGNSRQYAKQWAFFWGTLVLQHISGDYGSDHFVGQWDWYPQTQHPDPNMPGFLRQPYSGNWKYSDENTGNDAILTGGTKEFARLSNYITVGQPGESPVTHSNDPGMYQLGLQNQNGGTMDQNQYTVIWMVTESRSR